MSGWASGGPTVLGGYSASDPVPDEPVPGDPELVRALAESYARAAAFAGEQAAAVRRMAQAVGADASWVGGAAEAFLARAGALPGQLDQVAARHHRAAQALRDYAPALESAQRAARAAADRARAAQERAGLPPTGFASTRLMPSSPTPAEAELAAELARARQLLAAAIEERDRAAARCVRALHAASDDRLRDPHGWRRALGAVSALAGATATWLGASAVVLCVVPGLGEVVGAVALTAAAVALVSDLALTVYGDKSAGDVALDALGVLPGGRALRLWSQLPADAVKAGAVLRGAAHLRPVGEVRAGLRAAAAAGRGGVGVRVGGAAGGVGRRWGDFWRSSGGLLDDLARARELRRGGAALVVGSHAVNLAQAGLGVPAQVDSWTRR